MGMTTEQLVRLLRALAGDCENTDGWEEAVPTCTEAADKLEHLARSEMMLRVALDNLRISAQRAANKYGRDPVTDGLLDWTEWRDVRDGCRQAEAALRPTPIGHPHE